MILAPGTTWGDLQSILDNTGAPLHGPTNYFEMTREEIMSFPPDQLIFPDDDEDWDDEDEDWDEEDYVPVD